MQKQKGVSTLVGIIIIIAVAAILFGGVFAYQYFTKPEDKNLSQQQIDDVKPNFQAVPITEWETYKKEDWGVEFKYPPTFGTFEMYGDVLSFSNETERVFFLEKTTLEDIKKCEESCVEARKTGNLCAPCSTAYFWKTQKDFIETSDIGKFVCDGEATETKTDDCESCEITEIGGIKMLINRGCWSNGGYFDIRVFYKNNTLFSFLPLYQDYMGDIFARYGTDEKTILSTFKFTK